MQQATGFRAVGAKALQQAAPRGMNEGPHGPQRKQTREASSGLESITAAPQPPRPAAHGDRGPWRWQLAKAVVPRQFRRHFNRKSRRSPDKAWQAPHCRGGRALTCTVAKAGAC